MPSLWSTEGWNYLVGFDEAEMAKYRRLAELRYLPKRQAGIPRNFVPPQDGVENDLLGIMGEAGVAHLLESKFDETISLAGDGGVQDLEKDGVTVQVKTSWYPSGNLLFNDPSEFKAEVAVLVVKVKNDHRLRIAGWIPRDEFLAIHQSKDFGFGERAFVIQNELYPMRQLELYIRRKKAENDARLVEFEERAAIMEFEGGLTRDEAERLAKADLENTRR